MSLLAQIANLVSSLTQIVSLAGQAQTALNDLKTFLESV